MSYLDFYGLQTEPFSNAPNERFYYNSAQHARALTRIMYVAETMKGLAVVIGDVGTGKTTLARKVLDSLPSETYESALLVILHAEISQEWLLRRIAQQLGIENPATEKLQIIGQLYRKLLHLHEMGKKAVVLIDEAQMLNTRELMEEFRGLLNLEVTAHKLITFIFFGLPEMEDTLSLDQPLLQRVAMKIRLSTLTDEATKAYVVHRMNVAGNRETIFTDGALKLIYSYSDGFPRKINILCDNALFQGFLMRQRVIDRKWPRTWVMTPGRTPTLTYPLWTSLPTGHPTACRRRMSSRLKCSWRRSRIRTSPKSRRICPRSNRKPRPLRSPVTTWT